MPGSKGYRRLFSDPFDDRNFNRIFRDYYTALCRYCMKFVNDRDTAEDIVQDQFVYIWEKNLDISDAPAIRSYLFKAVKSRSVNHIQKRFKNPTDHLNSVSELMSSNIVAGPDKELELKELDAVIQRALQSLPDKCRGIFILKKFGELNNKEIAEKLNISVKTVEAQMTIAFKKLSAFVSEHWELLVLLLIRYL